MDDRLAAQIDGELRSLFAGSPPPRLPLDFGRRLRREVATERRQIRSRRWRLAVMQAYWCVAALASGWLLVRLQLPMTALESPWAAMVVLMLGLSAAPAVLLLRYLDMDLGDLLSGTVHGLEEGHLPKG